ncbi:MAG: DUF1573 domain-containing protein [Patescibacteria group bacterium]
MSGIENHKNPIVFKSLITLSIVFALSLVINFILIPKNWAKLQEYIYKTAHSVSQPVSAQEIYPMFLCPCCGKPLDPDNICCEMAQERITFIDGLTAGTMSKEEVIMAYIKRYGLDSFVDKNQTTEFKQKLIAQAPVERPIISLNPDVIDFGDISQTEGEVTNLFEITNSGKTDLIINKLDTSCGCTSASIVFEGKEGPKFAMAGHGVESPKDWEIAIPAGKNAQLKVYYDPNVHPDFRGEAIREVYVFSNDPINIETKVKIELNQID